MASLSMCLTFPQGKSTVNPYDTREQNISKYTATEKVKVQIYPKWK